MRENPDIRIVRTGEVEFGICQLTDGRMCAILESSEFLGKGVDLGPVLVTFTTQFMRAHVPTNDDEVAVRRFINYLALMLLGRLYELRCLKLFFNITVDDEEATGRQIQLHYFDSVQDATEAAVIWLGDACRNVLRNWIFTMRHGYSLNLMNHLANPKVADWVNPADLKVRNGEQLRVFAPRHINNVAEQVGEVGDQKIAARVFQHDLYIGVGNLEVCRIAFDGCWDRYYGSRSSTLQHDRTLLVTIAALAGLGVSFDPMWRHLDEQIYVALRSEDV